MTTAELIATLHLSDNICAARKLGNRHPHALRPLVATAQLLHYKTTHPPPLVELMVESCHTFSVQMMI